MYAQQQKGTLVSGQVISVNKYTVQVERFLSQGGFAHVYLVRTSEPVNGTTHHVLKRIGVANESMLHEVKKEVDIMRILRGHPNIVYLIDAAWHRMSNGMYEVFILMEFCSGGGIIDMMNRRLRERLTEAEIMQIFVDVCEGTAAMHNLRPALLHRDLKVENILQASPSSYKLCDFGSAMPVAPRPPSTIEEIRALEADLNRHTTLQYRAPEMVDVYLRRPVDEKSDVWALGVLLYKLCYYTTPFEEHGVLAILNVQYKVPPYPVYSQQMIALISSMLREHNARRPTVFEVLDTVHKMRGTKPRFTYNLPSKQLLSLQKRLTIPSAKEPSRSIPQDSSASSQQNGSRTLEQSLEAITPMRRGRPPSPNRARAVASDVISLINIVDAPFGVVKAAKAHKSGLASISSAKSPSPTIHAGSALGDPWSVSGTKPREKKQGQDIPNGFGDTFEASLSHGTPQSIPRPISARTGSAPRLLVDAFDSLNILPSPRSQPLTLGEAQKAASSSGQSPSPQLPSYKFSISTVPFSKSSSPVSTGNLASTSRRDTSSPLKPASSGQTISIEQRFPSLEELDAGTFANSSRPLPSPGRQARLPIPSLPPRSGPGTYPNTGKSAPTSMYPASVSSALRPPSGTSAYSDGVRSNQVTGTAMRDSRKLSPSSRTQPISSLRSSSSEDKAKAENNAFAHLSESKPRETLSQPTRPMVLRKHRSSISISAQADVNNLLNPASAAATETAPSVSALVGESSKDWLTGSEYENMTDNVVLRASPEKRSSIVPSPVPLTLEQQAFRSPSPVKRKPVPIHKPIPIEIKRKPPPNIDQETDIENVLSQEEKRDIIVKDNEKWGFDSLQVDGREKEAALDEKIIEKEEMSHLGLTESWSPESSGKKSISSEDEDAGPEDAVASVRPSILQTNRKTRQGSVHDLVDLWGGSSSPQLQKSSAPKSEKRNTLTSPAVIPRSSTPDFLKGPGRLNRMSLSSSMTGQHASARPAPPVSRKPSLNSGHAPSKHLRRPSSPNKSQPSSSPGKSRPQSMVVVPVQRAHSDNQNSQLPVLSPPKRATQRRSSISDIVDHYEAIGGNTGHTHVASKAGYGPAPVPKAKPARLRVASPTTHSMPSAIHSPSIAGTWFPRLSPTASPERSTANLPSQFPPQQRATSPAPSLTRQTLSSVSSDKEASRAPSPSLMSSHEAAKAELPPERRSPSPERSYQGVSKLIDKWQRKSEESEGGIRSGPPAGIKASNARFRREGITAGGGKLS